jgi:hypothetical protein
MQRVISRIAANMASKPGVSSAKRFKACKLRVVSVSTTGRKRAGTICLQASTNQVSSSQNGPKQCPDDDITSNLCPMSMDINSESLDDDNNSSELSQHHSRRLREYRKWEEIREMLVRCRYEREAFKPNGILCCECTSFAETRCLDCGHDVYYCTNCALNSHDRKNHFHVLETFVVRK